MGSKKNKATLPKPNKLTILFIVLFAVTLFSGPERLCSFVFTAPFNQYREIIGNHEEDFRNQKLGIGHSIILQYKENKRSVGELYSLTDIKFIPENKTLSVWEGEDKIETWNDETALIENMQRFRVKFALPVPEDVMLQGKTIKGNLHLKLSYPVIVKFTEKKSITKSETWDRPLSIYIFSKAELNKLSKLTNQMIKIWLACLGAFLFPILLLFANQIKKHKTAHPVKIE